MGFSLPDPYRELEHTGCHICSDGRLLIGKFTAWRDPEMRTAVVKARTHLGRAAEWHKKPTQRSSVSFIV